eukprot:scaffold141146_cov136-Phaeocystis_antarctica.AAC.1
MHYRTPKESTDHPKHTKIDTFSGGGSYGAGYICACPIQVPCRLRSMLFYICFGGGTRGAVRAKTPATP